MKRLFCLMMCTIMILTAAACGKSSAEETTLPETTAAETTAPETTEPETTVPETTEPETTEPETTEPETPAPVMTDKDAKPEDVLKAAAKALTDEGARFAFAADPVLDLTVIYEAPEPETSEAGSEMDMAQLMYGAIADMLLDPDGKLNIRLEPKTVGFYEAGKGAEAEIEFKNNLADRIKTLLALLQGAESEDDPSVAWITDVIKTSLYVDLTERKVYFLSPVTEAWNYAELGEAQESKPEVEEKVDLNELFEEYEWTVTDDQYILSGKMNRDTLSGSAAAGELPDEAVFRLTMVFDGEQRLTGAELVMDPFEKDLSGLIPGLSVKLDQFTMKGTIDYDTPESFAVPAEVAANAEKYEGDIPFISGGSDEPDEPTVSGQY